MNLSGGNVAINPNCNVIAVIGGKGGVGKSVFAANLALAIVTEIKQPTLLIDADTKSAGDQNVLLGIRPTKTVSDFASFGGVLTPQSFPSVVNAHPSGMQYLAAVKSSDESLNVSSENFMRQLQAISGFVKYVVIDCGNDLGPLQHAILQEATAAMLVTVPELLTINQTQKMVGELLAATYPLDMFQLVINKASPAGLAPQAISQTLRMPVLSIIPQDDNTVLGSVQRSTPFVSQPKLPISATYYDLVRKLTGGILQKLKTLNRPKAAPLESSESQATSNPNQLDPRTALKIKIHNELIRAMDLKKGITDTQGDESKEKALRQKTTQSITTILDKESPGLARDERSKIIKEVLEEALGLGPLEDLLADPGVNEIMVNGHKRIFIEKGGRVQLTPVTFTSNGHLRNVIERIVTPLGRRIDEKTPYVDARLKDGSRVNAVIEPLAIDGPALTIRKFKKGGVTAEKYIEWGSMTKSMVDFLRICVENGLNVVISGGTGSGKTTLLNMMSSFIPATDRIVTVEDAAELQLQQEHVVRLETRPANMEGTGAVTIRDLIRNALRMRPDRIVVGETRDGAALDMLQAMNTGHDGSMTTTHANSPRECIARLETLCMMAGMDLPIKAIREQVASAVHLIVQISRLSDGSRKILSVTEVCGMQGETVTLQEIFRFKETGFDKNRKIIGTFQAMGLIPTFIEKLEQKGVIIPRDIFSNEVKPTNPAAPGGPKPPATPQGGGVPKPGVPPFKKSS